MKHTSRHALASVLLLSLAFAGCGEVDPLNRQAVSGKVNFDGQPLKSATIQFHPATSSGIMSGAPITDGAYSIGREQGLPPGEYTVQIYAAGGEMVTIEEAPGEMTRAPKELIPARFNVKSEQKVTIEAGGSNSFDYDIPAT